MILSVVQDEERGSRLGVARYFTKPVDVRALVQEVAVVLRDAATETRIVVVDPPLADPEDRRHAERVRAALRDAGYAVEDVASAADALARRGTAHPPDLILVAADVARGTELDGGAHAFGVDVVLFQ